MLSVKDAQELMALQASLLQPTAEKAAAYSRHVYDIAAATNVEVTKAVEAQISRRPEAKFMGLVDSASKNAPAGSENAVALMRSAVTAANNAFESVQKATKQANDVAEANFKAMTATAVKTARGQGQARLIDEPRSCLLGTSPDGTVHSPVATPGCLVFRVSESAPRCAHASRPVPPARPRGRPGSRVGAR